MSAKTTSRPVLESELAVWRTAVGNRKVQHAMADAEVMRRFALATGVDPDVERQLPALGHWGLFVDAVAGDRIGPDGHPLRGDFLPPVHLPRRMFASAVLEFHSPLQVGRATECISSVTAVDHKHGQSGDLVFVNVQREVTQGGRLCIKEQQSLVYRGMGERLKPIAEIESKFEGHTTWTPSPVDLFRFSAVTFNSHRIHYDRPYAQDEEGYPDLVVQGPFTAVKLLDYACSSTGRPAVKFAFRGAVPLFVSQPIRLCVGDSPASFVATRCDGIHAMTAQVEFA
jgi:3-methylfumaryl-CoA hydratase